VWLLGESARVGAAPNNVMKNSLIALLFTVCASANAALGPMIFSPTAPTTNDSIQFSVLTSTCEGFISTPTIVQREGNVVRVIQEGVRATDPILCVFLPGVARFNLGLQPAGQYRIELYIKSIDFNVGTFLVQTGNLTITGAPTLAQAPALSSWSMLVLVLSVLGIGVVVGRKR
jgi:hypothetical protein